MERGPILEPVKKGDPFVVGYTEYRNIRIQLIEVRADL
tara:strand:+ start:361 stop:474 length:114 start_codon:yes stop_codon:yes gene_type:complete